MSLVAEELERHGLPTVAIRFRRRGEEEPRAPRALRTQFRHGFPDDPPDQPGRLLSMMDTALSLFGSAGPAMNDYRDLLG